MSTRAIDKFHDAAEAANRETGRDLHSFWVYGDGWRVWLDDPHGNRPRAFLAVDGGKTWRIRVPVAVSIIKTGVLPDGVAA